MGGSLSEGRYLVFDFCCSTSAEIAAVVEEAGGRLSVCSLNDPQAQRSLSEVRPGWKWEPTLLEVAGERTLAFTGLSMKTRMLMWLGPWRTARVARIVRRDEALGFEIALVPSPEHPGDCATESVKEIDRRTALKTLRTCGLATFLLPGNPRAREGRGGDGAEKGNASRIRFVRLTPRQTLRLFASITRRDPDVRRLYASLEGKGFGPIRGRARGAVLRAYAADGIPRGEGLVIELPHRSAGGTEASFYVSIKDGMTGGSGAKPTEVKADYAIREGGRIDSYTIEGGRATPSRTQPNRSG
jgi:hypothetical protein